MPRLHETLETPLSIGEAFAFVADFANSQIWDPGTVSSERLDDVPVGVGAAYRLMVRMGSRVVPMEYRITGYQHDRRVVLTGTGSHVTARDEIRFEPLSTGGTRVDYIADIRLGGWMRLVEPFAGGAFRKIGADARAGLQRTLDGLARARAAA